MPSFLIGAPQLERGNHFAVALQLGRWQDPWGPLVHTLGYARIGTTLQGPIKGGFRDIIDSGHLADHLVPRRTAGRERTESPAQMNKGLRRQWLRLHHLPPRAGGG